MGTEQHKIRFLIGVLNTACKMLIVLLVHILQNLHNLISAGHYMTLLRMFVNCALIFSKPSFVLASTVSLIFGSVLEARISAQPYRSYTLMPSIAEVFGYFLTISPSNFFITSNFLLSEHEKLIRSNGYCGISSTIADSAFSIEASAQAIQ